MDLIGILLGGLLLAAGIWAWANRSVFAWPLLVLGVVIGLVGLVVNHRRHQSRDKKD